MKQPLRRVTFAILLSVSGTAVHAQAMIGLNPAAVQSNFSFNNGLKLYTGASLIYSTQDSSCETPFFDGSCEDGSFSGKVFGGARFNPMFGAELAYVSQNEAELKGVAGSLDVSGNNKISGYQVTGVGYLPLQSIPNLELMGKAGAMFWERETQIVTDGVKKPSSDDGVTPMIGLGAQYQLNQNVYLRGEWEHIINTGSDSDHETDLGNYSVGVSYSTL